MANERNAGRKKKDTKGYTVRTYPHLIKEVRRYAKEISEEFERGKK